MPKFSKDIRNVAVALNLSGASGRDLLTGISTYAKERCHWRLRIFARSEDFTPDALEEMDALDGVITSEIGEDGIPDLLARRNVPTVVIGMKDEFSDSSRRIAFVRNDDEDIGKLAAGHLFSLGNFRSFGYVPNAKRTYWSILREKGFRAFLRTKSVRVKTYDGSAHLRDWLVGLPKPAAVMAAFDERALDVLTACGEARLRVPDQVAIIGVDNDELLCDFCDPPLSSIQPDHVREGALAAGELARLLRSPAAAAGKTVRCRDKRLVRRESTAPVSPATHIIGEMRRYVRHNVTANLRADDVIRHLRVSRRLMDLRLREAGEPTLAKIILRCRLEEVARRLRTSKATIGQIAAACSFENVQHLANAFKRHFGITMTAYRAGK